MQDDDGYLYFLERDVDMIVSAGFKDVIAPVGVPAQGLDVAGDRRRQGGNGAGGDGLDVLAPGLDQRQPADEGLMEIEAAVHGLVGQADDVGAAAFGVRMAVKRDLGQGLERLEADQGRIKVDEQDGEVPHPAKLDCLRRSGKRP